MENPAKKRVNPLTGLIFLHPLIITFILLSSSYPINYSIPYSYWFIITFSTILSIIFFLFQRWLSPDILSYLLFISDVPLIAIMIHCTGGIQSMFPLLYVLLIITAAIYLFRKGAYIISLISVIFFLGLMLYESTHHDLDIKYVLQRFYLFSLLFLFTAILSGYLSERYKIRTEELKKLTLTTEEIVKSLPSGLLSINSAGSVVYTNITQDNISSLVHLYLAKFMKNPEKGNHTRELKINDRYYLLSCSIIGKGQGALAILQDLTEIRRLEETSRISKQTKMLAELGGSLAHEIRNPLASIRGALEIVAQSRLPKTTRHFIDMAIKESTRLNEIVTDFLNFSQFVPKKTNPTKVSDVINEALADLITHLSEKKINIRREGVDFICMADINRLKSGVGNILSNACEVSNPGGEILIKTGKDNTIGWIEITDYGPGIPQKDLRKIFIPFYTTKKGGTGLGLSIAQKIIEAHNGKIAVSSKIGKGTTFRILLPLA
ncbi:MAG: two-component system sensor histidine kinase NtrB [bacterium]